MAEILSPFVLWGQKKDNVSLKIELRNVRDQQVDLNEEKLTFAAEGLGAKGVNKYGFEIEFYLPVDPEESQYRVTEQAIEFQIRKQGDGAVWPRLTSHQVKYPWLKIDFEKFAFEDDSDDESEIDEKASEQEILNNIERELMEVEEPKILDFKTVYLFLYNLFQFIGFLYIAGTLQYRYLKYGHEAITTAVSAVGSQLMLCQFVAMLEIIHPLLGLVKTSFTAPMMQVTGRNFILFVILLQEPRLHDAPVVYFLFLVWAAIELFRYPFYMLACLDIDIHFVTWLRYTVWIPLYPLGFVLEGTLVIMAIPLYTQTEKFSLLLPNSVNMAFYFPWLLHAYLLLLASVGYSLLKYMTSQRKKKLGTTQSKQGSKKQR